MIPDEIRAAIAAADEHARQCRERYDLSEFEADGYAYEFLKAWLLSQVEGK